MNAIPRELSLRTISRRPTLLPPQTIAAAMTLLPPFKSPFTLETGPDLLTSIILVTFNGEPFTRMCIASLIAAADSRSCEIIVVDNGSTDGTTAFLRSVAEHHSHVRLIFNSENRGFAAANNQGLALARGSVLVLLNNDTIVPPGFLAPLHAHLRDPAIGLIGPVTNRASNESGIETSYNTYGEFLDFSAALATARAGECFEIPMLIMFAVAMRRDVFDRVGFLDEHFGVGLFEDDDYSLRVRELGYHVVCASDVFVHHFGQGSFGQLVASGEFNRLFELNRSYFEQKWKRPWQPHQSRETAEYETLRDAIARAADTLLPSCDDPIIVAVISRGDQRLVDALSKGARLALHFPRAADGSPLAHHPADGSEANKLLNAETAAGAGYLLIPRPYLWWLEFYQELAAHLASHCRRYDPADGSCVIFDLSGLTPKAPTP
jgi:GT2 family glycosyltransferase